MILKKPKTLILQEQREKQQLEASVKPDRPKRKRTVASYRVEASIDDETDSDFDEHDAKRQKANEAVRKILGDLSNASARCYQPLARLPKHYDPLSVLNKKFKIPSSINGSQSVDDSSFGVRRTLGMRRRAGVLRALHDHTAENALVLWDPAEEEVPEPTEQDEKKASTGKREKSLSDILGLKKQETKKVHVVVDPVLAKVLRPHQIDGVKFLFRCTTGKVDPNAYGCIMADEMGLGKTLQCISLVWTLLRQSGELGKPTINKAIITCPSSLVRNWANEFVKWLGETRVRPLTIDNAGSKEKISAIKRWAAAQGQLVNPVLIISYETLRSYTKYLKKCPVGLLLCDEGHRLKNGASLLFQELNSLQVRRRVILSGTPIQNDLSEYYSLLDFANPGLLGTTNEFRKNYENPILRGRDADASDKERQISDEKVAEFWAIVSKFTIRRTNDILSKYLPVKYEHVVFCKLAPLQQELYNIFLTSPEIRGLLRGQGSQPLKAITMLKKLCNHPALLDLPNELEGSERILPPNYQGSNHKSFTVNSSYSGKFMVLDRMLARIKNETNDKIVLVSNYTQTLDVFEAFCRQKQYGVLRLDGSMNIQKRQKLVDRFNDPEGDEFVFLLSSKAGGCGLNLIGANRLVLFDPDWNPAADQQALARVWRDGQRKDCFIYRFIGAGTIEEKIFQRQSHKQSLSNCVVDEATDTERHFSLADMRQLFQLNTASECETHDTFKCKRCIQGKQHTPSQNMNYGDAST
ncbi:P-loop containing nucleoside triphosphate hydrolase protein [Radiomyces spectabilis]|uniref:P-loop containing nucleoside triphosphate hydrolase protein n=1 Tax=Radiomyces spectabilis TaxID=64574 RepID=UPI00221E3BEC|nr:P-loop containing nucleoside triphosphate hydrolase protein [Radiomyces spectabilis]KAI8371788.1 P-loop containing nucleoside triphosphate hydrolase protein [Radiomyces spectabilis]